MWRLMFCFCVALLISVSGTAAARATPLPAVATYAKIDVPGAAWTHVYGISRTGRLGRTEEIVGAYGDATGSHGFLLSGGHYTTLDFPGATGGTTAYGINGLHQIVGTYTVTQFGAARTAGWLYEAGLFQHLDYGSTSYEPHALNNSGAVAGSEFGAPPAGGVFYKWYGFDTTIDHQHGARSWSGASGDAKEAGLFGVNNRSPRPDLAGYYRDKDDGDMHGYLAPAQSSQLSFDVPGTTGGTMARGINDTGQIVGSYGIPATNGSSTPYPYPGAYGTDGFISDHGRFARIDYPRAARTVVNAIANPDPLSPPGYDVVGTYRVPAANGLHDHGFIATVAPVKQSTGTASRPETLKALDGRGAEVSEPGLSSRAGTTRSAQAVVAAG